MDTKGESRLQTKGQYEGGKVCTVDIGIIDFIAH